jgi:hypothetical protein
MLMHLESTDDAPSVESLMVMPQLVDVVSLLVGEIAFDEQLAREIVISREGDDGALGATAV